MKSLRLYAAVSCFFLFLSCVENEIETFDISIDIQPHGSATIEPKRISIPLFCASIRLAKPRPLRNRQKKY